MDESWGKLSKSFGDIALEYFPDATDDEIDYILWNHTGYPSFWSGARPVEVSLRRQLAQFKRISEKGQSQCMRCTRGFYQDTSDPKKPWHLMGPICRKKWKQETERAEAT